MTTTEGALNVDRIVDEALDAVHGYTRHQEQVTALASAMDASQTSLTVTEGGQVSRGLIEIGNEQMLVKTVDNVGGAVTLQPFGRGVNNTTAATHGNGDKVIMAPLYTRRRVRDVLFGVLREIFPTVFAPGYTTIDATLVRSNYTLPADCHDVLAVDWKVPGPSRMWTPLRRWRMNRSAATPEIELLGAFFPGSDNVRVLYMKSLPADITDDNIANMGYTQDIHDILVLGVSARLLLLSEPGRLQMGSVAAHGRAEVVPAGQLKSLGQDLYALFQRRVQQEGDRLLQRYASQPHFNR